MEESLVIKFPTMEGYYYCDEKKNDKDHELFTDSDMAAAAQQLMQLSDEENHSNNDNITDYHHDHDQEEIDQTLKIRSRRTWSKIEEIFGKEEEEAYHDHHDQYHRHHDHDHQRQRKKQKYRSLASVYRETRPTDDQKKQSS
ncbi:hypothetical protein TIFTF001_004108 [Ficus carica]|uniref:Uncharacterized protein n=1 Tax=Ficus carica TaxID=3494 RepID=A0AA88CX77_FICCA|nr:hypothetical protein TIFTF001_004108 [Ficus carica]